MPFSRTRPSAKADLPLRPGTGQVGWPAEIRARFVEDIEQAAIILWRRQLPRDELEARFAPLAMALDKPFLCANPDRKWCPGVYPSMQPASWPIALRRPGRRWVTWYGKPDPYAFHCAAGALAERGAKRLLFVGDSLVTDVPGAVAAGIDCLWLAATGIHREALGLDFNRSRPARDSSRCSGNIRSAPAFRRGWSGLILFRTPRYR